MSRSLSSAFRKALYDQETGEVLVCLLTISHDDLAGPIYISTDPTQKITSDPLLYGTISNGVTFDYIPVDVVFPQDINDAAPVATLEIDNTDLGLITEIRSIIGPATVKIECALASAPDVIEMTFPRLLMGSASYDQSKIKFGLTIEALTTEPFPGPAFIPSDFPGLY